MSEKTYNRIQSATPYIFGVLGLLAVIATILG